MRPEENLYVKPLYCFPECSETPKHVSHHMHPYAGDKLQPFIAFDIRTPRLFTPGA